MSRQDALSEAAELLFTEFMASNSYRGFVYHPEYGLVPWGRYPSSTTEEEFNKRAILIDPEADLETLLMAIEGNPPV